MKNTFKEIAPVNLGSFLSSYFDFFAFSGPLLLGLALSFGLRKSAGMNNILCILNLGVVFYVFIAVMLNANLDNWKIDPSTVAEQYRNQTGAGGFFPFGFSGTIKGAATCFFGFVGFDCIATTGEEVKNPRKAVPRAILFSLLIIFLAYFGVALLTLMWPYYLLVRFSLILIFNSQFQILGRRRTIASCLYGNWMGNIHVGCHHRRNYWPHRESFRSNVSTSSHSLRHVNGWINF
jgi:amino acid transporter